MANHEDTKAQGQGQRPTTNDQLPMPAFPANIDGGGAHWSLELSGMPVLCRAYGKLMKLGKCRENRERFNRTGGYIPEGCFNCHWRTVADLPPAQTNDQPPNDKLPKLLCHLYCEFFTLRQCRDVREEQAHELEECARCSWRQR